MGKRELPGPPSGHEHNPKGSSTQCLRSAATDTITDMVLEPETSNIRYWDPLGKKVAAVAKLRCSRGMQPHTRAPKVGKQMGCWASWRGCGPLYILLGTRCDGTSLSALSGASSYDWEEVHVLHMCGLWFQGK